MDNVTLSLTKQESAILAAIVAVGNSIIIGAAVAFGDVRGRREFDALETRFTSELPDVNGKDVHPTNTLFGKLITLAESARENYPVEMRVVSEKEEGPVTDEGSGVIDLMAALKQSLANKENVS